MKSTAILAIAASTVATVASAELLKYGAPIATTTWTAGQDATISWTNTCAGLPNTTFPVMLQVQRADGVQTPVTGVPSLGDLDCSKAGSLTVKVPTTVPTGSLYSILVSNTPDLSYSALFTIKNDAMPAPSSNVTTTGAPTATSSGLPTASVNGTATATKPSVTAPTTTTTTKPNNAGALKTGSAAALAVAGAVAALIF